MSKGKDIVVITIGRIIAILTSIISIRLLTTLLAPGEVGRLNIILAISGWFGLVMINPIGMYINRKIIEWNKDGLAFRYLFFFGKYLLKIAIFSIIFLISIQYLIGLVINIKLSWLLILIFCSILFTCGNMAFISYLNLLGHRLWFVVLTVLTLWSSLAMAAFFVLQLASKAEYWLSGQLIGQFLILLVAIIVLSRHIQRPCDFRYNGEQDKSFTIPVVFNFAWPLAIGTFLYWCHTQGYRFVFQRIAGTEVLGLFVVGFGIGSNLMIAFETIFNQYYHPIFYQKIANSNEPQRAAAWNKYAYAFFPAMILVCVYLSVSGPLLAKIFTGEKFYQVGDIIVWGVIAEGIRMLTSVTALVSHAQIETRPLIMPSFIGVMVALLGVVLFVRFNPFHGCGFALSLGWLAAFAYLSKNMRKLLPIKFPLRRLLYTLALSIPLFSLLIVVRLNNNLTTLKAILILIAYGLYMLSVQIILARKWLVLPIKLDIIDNFENKFKCCLNRIANI